MQHLDEGIIHAWLDGALPSAEAAQVETHAATCAECAARVAEARGLIAGSSRIVSALDVVPANVIPMPSASARESSSLWRKLALTPSRAAIAALLLVGVASMFSVRHRSTPRGVPMGTVVGDPSTQVVEARPDKPAPKPAPKAADHPIRSAKRADTVIATAAPAGASPASAPAAEPAAAPERAAAPRLAPTPGLSLAEVVTTSVPAAAAKARVDTVDARDRVNADAPAMMRRLYSNGATGAGAAAMRNVSLEGCYSIPDSVRRQTSQLPTGYALQKDSVGANIVRALNSSNHPDSVVVGAIWLPLPPSSVIVRLRLNDHPSAILLGPSRRVDCRP